MSVLTDMRWQGTAGANPSAATPFVGAGFVHLSGNNDGVIVAGGAVRVGTANVDNVYACTGTPLGVMADVSFGIVCHTDLGQDVVVSVLYGVSQGVSAGLRWGSRAEWALSFSGPSLPFGGTVIAGPVNPVPGRTYICRLQVTPRSTTFWVDGAIVAAAGGTDDLGITSPGRLAFRMSGALTIDAVHGWHLGRVRATTANARPIGRDIPSGLSTALSGRVMRLCMCIKVVRGDGTTFGFTTHDRDVVLDGLTYEAMGATQSTNIRQEVGGQPDNFDMTGTLTSSRITESDMQAGLYDNAMITVYLCDWSDPSLGSVTLPRGNIGDVTMIDGQFTAGVRSLMQRMQQQTIELMSPTCRVHRLGDARCKVDTAGNTADGKPITSAGTVTSLTNQLTMVLSGIQTEAGFYSYGTLTATSGPNAGASREIKVHAATASADERLVSATTTIYNDISYRSNINMAPSASPVFNVPAGNWDQASIVIKSHWTLRGAFATSPDSLAIQVPTGGANDLIIRSASNAGDFIDNIPLGPASIAAINLAAGGTFTISLRHTAQQATGAPFMHVSINNVQLQLLGYASASTSQLILHEAFPFPVAPGDTFTVQAGCNRLLSTCKAKFNNVINFRGEPNIPGTDKLMERGRPPS